MPFLDTLVGHRGGREDALSDRSFIVSCPRVSVIGLFCSLASLVGDSGLPGAEHVAKEEL